MSTLEAPPQEISPEAQEQKFDRISFRDIEGGNHEVVHPTLVEEISGIPREEDEVKVVLSDKAQNMSFGEYLKRIGVKYDWFFKERKQDQDKSLQELLRDLHQKSVDNRTAVSAKKHRTYTHESPGYDNLQQETAKDHGPLFIKTINDLGIDGIEAREARYRQDYLDGIDEILELDPKSLATQGEEEGEKIIIGIQRSFRDKKREITKDPVRFFPEDPQAGAIFRVFIQEDLDDYVDKNNTSYMQRLLEIRAKKAREAGVTPDQYAKTHRNEGLPPISEVLPKGASGQIKRVLNVLKQIKKQMEDYLESYDFKKQDKFIQAEIKRKAELLDIDNFINEVEELKEVA